MQCAALKQPCCSSLENINVEQQQQSLFDVSIIKLQHEQLRHGVEPRLLRFVLINNALRSLQGHMLQIESEDSLVGLAGDETRCESSDVFFYNTFKNGSLSSLPLSPPTPVKVTKLESFTNQSPLVEHQEALCPSHDMLTSPDEERVQPAACFETVSCEEGEEDNDGIEGRGGKERRLQNGFGDVHLIGIHLGKRSRDWTHEDAEGEGGGGGSGSMSHRCHMSELKDLGVVGIGGEGLGGGGGGGDAKRPCKPPSLIINSAMQKVPNGLNSLNSLNTILDLDPFPSLPFPSSPPSPSSPLSPSSLQQTPHYNHTSHYTSSSEETDKDSLTPSPIDFTNVDPTLYDFDTAVLQVGSTESVAALDSHQDTSLPSAAMTPLPACPVASNTSSHVTLTSTTSASPLVITTPILSPSTTQFPLFSTAVVSTQRPCESTTTPEASLPPFLDSEKLSLLSADSMVSTYPPGMSSKGGSCSMEALVRAQTGNGLLGGDDTLCCDDGSLVNTDGRSLPSSPEHAVEDEIEHIVKELLMT